jgi:hypothetical protein
MKKHNLTSPVLMPPSVSMIAASGCNDDDKNAVATSGGDLETGAKLRVVHASPNAPAVDVFAKGAAAPVVFKMKIAEVEENPGPNAGSEGHGDMIEQRSTILGVFGSSGASTVDLDAGGTMPELSDESSFSTLSPAVQVPPAISEPYVGVGGSQPGATVLTLAEMFEESASPRYRDVHASPETLRVDVGLWDGMTFSPVSDFNDLGFGESSSDMFQILPEGTGWGVEEMPNPGRC